MEAPNHYELLCVAPGATAEDIRIAYRRLIRIYHPDVANAAGAAMTLRLNDAQRELLDPSLRAQYDRVLQAQSRHAQQTRPSRMPDANYRAPRQNTDWQPPPPQAAPAASSVPWNPARYGAWMTVMIAAMTTVLIATGVVFAICYSGPLTIFTPRLLPPIVIAIAWLVGGLNKPPKLLIALMVIGASLWPLAAAGVEPFNLLNELPAAVLPCLTITAVAIVVFRIAAPRASTQSRVRRARRHSPAFAR